MFKAMEHRMLLIMVFVGFFTSTYALNQYHFVNQAKSFADAQLYCRNTFTDLATINNMADMKGLLSAVTDNYTGAAWIGLYSQNTPLWHWSLSMPYFYAPGETNYRNWGPGQPDSSGGNDCGVMDENGQFLTSSCTVLKCFICYDAQSDLTHIFINDTKTWQGAQRYCRLNHTDLASVRNLEENQQIQNLITTNNICYIGLFKDSFVWSDNSSSSFRYWVPIYPASVYWPNSCVGLYVTEGQWMCAKCSVAIPFFCYSKNKKQILRVKVRSDQNVNDLAVKAAILGKIQQELNDHGIAENTELAWAVQPDGNVFQKKPFFVSSYNTTKCG